MEKKAMKRFLEDPHCHLNEALKKVMAGN